MDTLLLVFLDIKNITETTENVSFQHFSHLKFKKHVSNPCNDTLFFSVALTKKLRILRRDWFQDFKGLSDFYYSLKLSF